MSPKKGSRRGRTTPPHGQAPRKWDLANKFLWLAGLCYNICATGMYKTLWVLELSMLYQQDIDRDGVEVADSNLLFQLKSGLAYSAGFRRQCVAYALFLVIKVYCRLAN